MIFDTHCHYNLEPLFESWSTHWRTAQEHGVTESVVVGTDLQTSQRALDLASKNPAFRASVAIHPSEYQAWCETQDPNDSQTEALIATQIATLTDLAKNPTVVAIGETGLDYFRLPDNPKLAARIKSTQQKALAAHLELAYFFKLPVIIHVRDQENQAYEDVLRLLKSQQEHRPRFILHCVSGPESYIAAALELGAYLGIAGNVTYKSAEHIRNLVRSAPQDRLLLETDAPFLPPQEFRGKTCEPWMISLTGEYLAEELNLSLDQLYQNAKTFFAF